MTWLDIVELNSMDMALTELNEEEFESEDVLISDTGEEDSQDTGTH